MIGRHLWDKGFVRLNGKGKSATAHLPFRDTVVLLANAESAQVKESLPLLQDCFTLYLECAPGKDIPQEVIPAPSPGEHAQQALDLLRDDRYECSALLEKWRKSCQEDPYWTERIAATVRSDARNSGSQLAPWGADDDLRARLRSVVMTDFITWVKDEGFLTEAEIADWHSSVTPPAPETTADTDTLPSTSAQAVIEVIRRYVAEHKDEIVPEGTPASAEAAKAGAWRTIGGKTQETFLMLTESDFASLYRRLAKAVGLMPVLPVNASDWLAQVLQNLREEGVIKCDGTSYRFRYRLLDLWKDKDYVVALKRSALIDDSEPN